MSCPPPNSAGCAATSSSTTCASASGRTSSPSFGSSPSRWASRWTTSARPIQWANNEGIHISLLSGLLSHIGLLDERKREYAGARGTRFAIFPGSALFKKSPAFVMAAELVETSRFWARVAAKFDPLWAEQVAPDLVKRSYSEPHWSSRPRRGHGPRKSHLVWRSDHSQPQDQLRPDRPRTLPGTVHPPCLGGGRVEDPPQILPPEPGPAAGDRGTRNADAAPRYPGGRPNALRVLRCPGWQGRGVRKALRQMVEGRPPSRTPPCWTSTNRS